MELSDFYDKRKSKIFKPAADYAGFEPGGHFHGHCLLGPLCAAGRRQVDKSGANGENCGLYSAALWRAVVPHGALPPQAAGVAV